jgi:hypothetical protein
VMINWGRTIKRLWIPRIAPALVAVLPFEIERGRGDSREELEAVVEGGGEERGERAREDGEGGLRCRGGEWSGGGDA